jgi:predicted transcriptional regulator
MQSGWPETAGNGRETDTDLSPVQEEAALALAAGLHVYEAARKAGCGERTIRTWLRNDPPFAARVRELRAARTSQTMGMLVACSGEAIETIYRIMKHGSTETIRLRAAEDITDYNFKARALDEMEDRIRVLEERIEALATPLKVKRCS